MLRLTCLILALFVLGFSKADAQLSFRISNYNLQEHGAGNKNWDIATDGERVFVANSLGLIVLENTEIQFFEIPNQTVLRSVAYIDNRIYTGSFEEFGFWEPDKEGVLQYTSLSDQLETPMGQNDEIWRIIEHHGTVYFHSFGLIYAFNKEEVYRLNTQGSYMFLYKIGAQVFTQLIRDGLFELVEDSLSAIPGSEFLGSEEIRGIVPYRGSSLLIGTTRGIYTFDGQEFQNWNSESIEEVLENNINAITRTEDKIFIGTIRNGVYIYDTEGNLLANINTESQLKNNTVLSITVDTSGNIWVGMDKGLAYIAFDTPIQNYRGTSNDIGSVYTASLYRDELYVGTNQGIYWYKKDKNGYFYDQELIVGSQGPVWLLTQFDGHLYGGLNDGTYLITNKTLERVSNISGGYTLKSYPHNSKDVLVQSTYTDVVVYQKSDSIWKESHVLSGFRAPARFMEFDHLGNIWLGHTVRRMFQVKPNIPLDSIDQVIEIGEDQGLAENPKNVFKFDGRIFTSSEDKMYEWDAVNGIFVPFTALDKYFTTTGAVENIVPAGNYRYWVIKESEISLFEIHLNSITHLYTLIPDMYGFEMVEGYPNVSHLNGNTYLISLADGFAILNVEDQDASKYPEPRVMIQSVRASNSRGKILEIDPVVKSRITSIANANNNIFLSWASSQVVGNRVFFQYKLDGLTTEWSNWGPDTEVNFERLLPGSYTFVVRSISQDGKITETANFPFVINQPWFSSKGAYFFYFLILVSLIFMIRLYISRRQWRALSKELEMKHQKTQREREKAEQEVIKLTNEKLQTEVEHKSAQLAFNTMAMIRKNNLLSSLKKEVDHQKKELGKKLPSSYYSRITRLIEQGIEDENEWEIFEQLYDQAHGDFFKRLKEKHPQLTPSDLRLCAYLRMNLASKEIAPLLNISVRGVEERRYRLRKRMNLSTEVNLTELIMTF
ncbi:MAG: hypothetical protein MI700_14670 [Balneolales bacterium]|nr:hypothetical protein [Balneolales bacterium]